MSQAIVADLERGMTKIDKTKPYLRIVVTSVMEYKPNTADYQGCSTLEEMLAVDMKVTKDDPELFIGASTRLDITGFVIRPPIGTDEDGRLIWEGVGK